MAKKRICFTVSEELSKQLAAFRAIHAGDLDVDEKVAKYLWHLISNHNKKTGVEVKIHVEKCPKCNGTLVQRKSKNVEFLGCSNFPKCRFTKK